MRQTLITHAEIKAKAQEKLKSLGFQKERNLGMNILELVVGESVVIQVVSDIEVFKTKKGKELEYVLVNNLETGETDMTFWLSGQLRYLLQSQKDGFINGKFIVTHLGKEEVEIDNETRLVNQYDVIAIS